jgi:hypothetical protein
MCNEKKHEKISDNFHARDQFEFYAFYQFLLHDKNCKRMKIPCVAVENISGAFFCRDSETERTEN